MSHEGSACIDGITRRCATLPARYLGLEDRGRIEPGAAADLVLVDRDCRLKAVFVEGRPIDSVAS